MRHSGLILGMILSVSLGSAACHRAADERGAMQDGTPAADGAKGDEITVTGCLTGAADRGAFVVTADRSALVSGALHAGDGETPTYTYELTGDTQNLAANVGRQVKVTGRLDDDRDDEVKVNDEEKTTLPSTQSGKETVTPAIETDAELEINVRRLAVSAVSPTGQPCAAGQ